MKNVFNVCWIDDHYRDEIVNINSDLPLKGDEININGQKGKVVSRTLITDGINSEWNLMLKDTKEMRKIKSKPKYTK